MDTEEHEELADDFERRADEMHRENAKLSEDIDSARKDWEAKRSDESVPGAVPRDEDLDSTSSPEEAEEAEDGPAARDEGAGKGADNSGDKTGHQGAPEREPDDA